jgi:hypothetical protein
MNVLATMGQLCDERSLESNFENLLRVCFLATLHYTCIIDPLFLIRSSESRSFLFFWGEVASPYDKIDLERVKKWVTEKRSIFTGQKIRLLAFHTASLEPVWGPPVKSQKIDRKIDFFEKIFGSKTSIPILDFEIPYFKTSKYSLYILITFTTRPFTCTKRPLPEF